MAGMRGGWKAREHGVRGGGMKKVSCEYRYYA